MKLIIDRDELIGVLVKLKDYSRILSDTCFSLIDDTLDEYGHEIFDNDELNKIGKSLDGLNDTLYTFDVIVTEQINEECPTCGSKLSSYSSGDEDYVTIHAYCTDCNNFRWKKAYKRVKVKENGNKS